MKLSLQQLSEQADVSERSIRYYIQKGLLPRPQGETRAAWYGQEHLANLLRIRAWQQQGLSLDAIADLLLAKTQPPVPAQRPGTVQVRSHLVLAAGLELVVSPDQAGLSQAQLRQLFLAVQAAYAELTGADPGAVSEPTAGP
jgi:DNA-binding transcriptional MerR regulator